MRNHRDQAAVQALYESLLKNDVLTVEHLTEKLRQQGLHPHDMRLKPMFAQFKLYETSTLTCAQFADAVRPCAQLVLRALSGELVVPDFAAFTKTLETIYHDVADLQGGNVATYIPQLAKVNPAHFAVAICTIDGQTWSTGDVNTPYCLQSTCKPVNYCTALDLHGVDVVHQHVGREPSGRSFNDIALDHNRLPHNPMINAGAIMCASLLWPQSDGADRFDRIMHMWHRLIETSAPQFNNAVFLSERSTCDRNMALAYFMRENGAFPPQTNMHDALDLYLQCCSIALNVKQHARVAAAFANGGVTPMGNQRIFPQETVQHCLSLMHSCGMYDFSGEYAFSVGIPAKSGVSGAIMMVVPGVLGMTVWSPALDSIGNSVRGLAFSKKFSEHFRFHIFNQTLCRVQQRMLTYQGVDEHIRSGALLTAASRGDIAELRRLISMNTDVNVRNYDARTALHVAASEGLADTVQFLLAQGANKNMQDRWHHTPLDDAKRHGHSAVVALL